MEEERFGVTPIEQVQYKLDAIKDNPDQADLFTVKISDLLDFTEKVFGSNEDLKVKEYVRDGSLGAHFDVYSPYLAEENPWIAVFNLAGRAALRTTVMSESLAQYYDGTFQSPTEEAYQARRGIAQTAFNEPAAKMRLTTLSPFEGIIIPQINGGRHIVHEVTPKEGEQGAFLKLLKPDGRVASEEVLLKEGFKNLGSFVTKSLAGYFMLRLDQIQEPVSRDIHRPGEGALD